MQGRDTFLLAGLPAGPTRASCSSLCPRATPIREYLEKIEKLLPAKDLSSVDLGGHEFVTAPIADLPFLFPAGCPAPSGNCAWRSVYAPLHSPSHP